MACFLDCALVAHKRHFRNAMHEQLTGACGAKLQQFSLAFLPLFRFTSLVVFASRDIASVGRCSEFLYKHSVPQKQISLQPRLPATASSFVRPAMFSLNRRLWNYLSVLSAFCRVGVGASDRSTLIRFGELISITFGMQFIEGWLGHRMHTQVAKLPTNN